MNTYVVTVTYGNRFHFLKQVIDGAMKEGVKKVIVVDNNSASECKEKLRIYEQELGADRIKVLYLDDNYGSAGGYKRGLEEAYNDPDCEFIWLLDDDNVPMKNSLKILIENWNNLNIENKEKCLALLSYRFKKQYLEKMTVIKNKPELTLGSKNSFLGFHVKDIPKKLIERMNRVINIKRVRLRNIKSGVVPIAPYGGLFINKEIIKKIGFPKEDYYLYSDDHEWSYRITKTGGEIHLILDSLIDDVDLSWNVARNVKETSFSILARGNKLRVYYSVRNRVFFEKQNLLNNIFIYLINIFFYMILVCISSRKNILLILNAVKDGYSENLGKKEYF